MAIRPELETGAIAIQVERSVSGDLTRLGVCGELTQQTRDRFKQLVVDEIAESRARHDPTSGVMKFRFDFALCQNVDSAGLGVLVLMAKRIRDAGGMLHAAGLNEDLGKLFKLTKLDQVIAVEGDGERHEDGSTSRAATRAGC